MARKSGIRVIATLAVLMCMALVPSGALASTASTHPPAPATATPSATVDSGGSPAFSKIDLAVLVLGATTLVVFGVGFRRISASLE